MVLLHNWDLVMNKIEWKRVKPSLAFLIGNHSKRRIPVPKGSKEGSQFQTRPKFQNEQVKNVKNRSNEGTFKGNVQKTLS